MKEPPTFEQGDLSSEPDVGTASGRDLQSSIGSSTSGLQPVHRPGYAKLATSSTPSDEAAIDKSQVRTATSGRGFEIFNLQSGHGALQETTRKHIEQMPFFEQLKNLPE